MNSVLGSQRGDREDNEDFEAHEDFEAREDLVEGDG